MKTVLLALIVVVALIVPSRAMSCRSEPEQCKAGECCVEIGIFGRCRPFKKEGEKCELTPITSRFDKHVYLMQCPCAEGLACEEDDSKSTLQGTCVAKK